MQAAFPAREHVLVMSEGDPMEGEGTRISVDLMCHELRDLVDELKITSINGRSAREHMERNKEKEDADSDADAEDYCNASSKTGRSAYVLRTHLPAHRVLNVLAESSYKVQSVNTVPGGEHGASHRFCWMLIR